MSSSRRLAISSLLCDDDPVTPASLSPTRVEEYHVPQQHPHARAPPPSPVRSALPTSPDANVAPRHEYRSLSNEQYSPPYGRFPGSPGSPLQPTASSSRMPQMVPVAQRSPSPTGHGRYAASTDVRRQPAQRRARHWEEGGAQWGSGEFPRAAQDPHPYASEPPRPPPSTLPSPPPSSAGSLLASIQERRRESRVPLQVQMNSVSRSPPKEMATTASLLLSSTSQKIQLTPTQPVPGPSPGSVHSIRQLLNHDAPSERSPLTIQRHELGIAPSRRPVPSVASPVAPRSALPGGPSGLDLLMQAATAERERIDEHRRLSGGDEQRPPQPPNLSPVSFRSDARLPPASPAPLSASSRISGYFQPEESDVRNHRHDSDKEARASKRRRSSPEPSQLLAPDTQRYDIHAGTSFSRSTSGGLEQDADDDHAKQLLPSPRIPTLSPHVPSYEHRSVPKHDADSEIRFSSRDRSADYSPVIPGLSVEQPTSAVDSYAEPMTGHLGRRSPPRSRPRPKKPGSAALALVERELRAVALSESSPRANHEAGDKSGEATADQRTASRKTSQKKTETKSSLSKDAVGDDEDVNEFFLSAFESPRLEEERIPSKSSQSIDLFDGQSGGMTSRNQETLPYRHPMLSPISARSELAAGPSVVKPPYREYTDPSVEGDEDHVSVVDEAGDPFLEELADAAGTATSEDDRTDYDDQETDAMEVDVDNELLSLIDGPSEPPAKSQQHLSPSPSNVGGHLAEAAEDQLPPGSAKAKSRKKGASKPKTKAKADEVAGSVAKPKTGAKQRPAKGEKAKVAKGTKESTAPGSSLPTPDSARGFEDFPLVTSSGRMITKTKKSAAASAIAVPEIKAPAPAKKKTTALAAVAADGSSSRSRSHSAMPRASADPDSLREKIDEERPDPGAEEDDKLYCICRTLYDEDRVMIACDRCDEWYHTQCLDMVDLEVDLIDQFVCPNCVAKNPDQNLQTTYKQRCFSGLMHPEPDSADACHKPSRGTYSKYCSDECGVRHLHRKLQAWTTNPRADVERLWESLKDAKRREGYSKSEPSRKIPSRVLAEMQNNANVKDDADMSDVKSPLPVSPELQDSVIAHLNTQLRQIVADRETRKKEMEVIGWRERLHHLASERAEHVEECGWDQRLCFGDEEVMEFGEGVMESYDEQPHQSNGHVNGDVDEQGEGMDVDELQAEGEWWCRGKRKCDRHAGWQKLRAAEIKVQKDNNEEALARLTTREREIRNRIEDIRHPQSRGASSALKFSVKLANGVEESGKKGKKKPVTATA